MDHEKRGWLTHLPVVVLGVGLVVASVILGWQIRRTRQDQRQMSLDVDRLVTLVERAADLEDRVLGVLEGMLVNDEVMVEHHAFTDEFVGALVQAALANLDATAKVVEALETKRPGDQQPDQLAAAALEARQILRSVSERVGGKLRAWVPPATPGPLPEGEAGRRGGSASETGSTEVPAALHELAASASEARVAVEAARKLVVRLEEPSALPELLNFATACLSLLLVVCSLPRTRRRAQKQSEAGAGPP